MVISYKAPTKQEPKFTAQALLVKEFMTTNLITFSPEESMHNVMETLVKKGISGAPVVNKSGKLVGIISEGDCLKQVVKGKYTNTPEKLGTVEDYMTMNPVFRQPEDNIMEVAQKFLRLRLRRFPVLDEGKLVGQISQRDVMKAINDLQAERWH